MLWLALILPDPALQATLRGSTDDAPLALVQRHPHAQVVAANARAQACGVIPGLTLAGALAVAPTLRLVDHDPAGGAALLEEVATWAGQFTPSLSIDPPDTLLLEVAASLRLFGGLPNLAEQVEKGIARLGLSSRQACAPTPLAARWLARQRPGSCIADPARLASAIATLPLDTLADGSAVGSNVLALLRAIGCELLGEVATLPRDALARRQGHAVCDALDRAFGRQPDPRAWFSPPLHYQARLPLLVPTERSDTLLFLLRRLLHGLAGWLGARQAGVDRLRLTFEHEGRCPPTELEILCGAPCRDDLRLALLAREHFERQQLPAPVDALQLDAAAPVPLPAQATDFFDDRATVQENAELLLARLHARLGRSAIRHLRVLADHRPEYAFAIQDRAAKSDDPDNLAAGPRPLWLLAQPRPYGRDHRPRLLSGPERIESGWWDGREVRRDYYLAQSRQGSLLWIFQDHDPPHGWHLHGYFG